MDKERGIGKKHHYVSRSSPAVDLAFNISQSPSGHQDDQSMVINTTANTTNMAHNSALNPTGFIKQQQASNGATGADVRDGNQLISLRELSKDLQDARKRKRPPSSTTSAQTGSRMGSRVASLHSLLSLGNLPVSSTSTFISAPLSGAQQQFNSNSYGIISSDPNPNRGGARRKLSTTTEPYNNYRQRGDSIDTVASVEAATGGQSTSGGGSLVGVEGVDPYGQQPVSSPANSNRHQQHQLMVTELGYERQYPLQQYEEYAMNNASGQNEQNSGYNQQQHQQKSLQINQDDHHGRVTNNNYQQQHISLESTPPDNSDNQSASYRPHSPQVATSVPLNIETLLSRINDITMGATTTTTTTTNTTNSIINKTLPPNGVTTNNEATEKGSLEPSISINNENKSEASNRFNLIPTHAEPCITSMSRSDSQLGSTIDGGGEANTSVRPLVGVANGGQGRGLMQGGELESIDLNSSGGVNLALNQMVPSQTLISTGQMSHRENSQRVTTDDQGVVVIDDGGVGGVGGGGGGGRVEQVAKATAGGSGDDHSTYPRSRNSHRSHPSSPSISGCGSTSDLSDDNDNDNDDDDDDEPEDEEAKWKARLEARRFEIGWCNFTYKVEPNFFEDPKWGKVNSLFHKEPRLIIKGISGGLRSGQMVALMGPSGAGKTCLLECISGVRKDGLGGHIWIRGRKKVKMAIVPQYDYFLPQFTVREIILYGSKLKNPYNYDHEQAVTTVIKQLGLGICEHNNIQRCSGGQQKRVAIAQELVSKPNILILDEPTSGLDSSCCFQTMKVMREVLDLSTSTDEPMAVVTTIHQPSAKVFQLFDLVYLLGKSGYTAYYGPPADLVSTITSVTGLECPQYSNPADFMIELVALDYGEECARKLVEHEQLKAEEYIRQHPVPHGSNEESGGRGAEGPMSWSEKTTSGGGESGAGDGGDSSGRRRYKIPLIKSSFTFPFYKDTGTRNNNRKKNNINSLVDTSKILLPLKKAASTDHIKHPIFWHIYLHSHRSFLQSVRDPILNNLRALIHLLFAAILTILYGGSSGEPKGCPPVIGLPVQITDPYHEDLVDLADNLSYLCMAMMMITYLSMMATVLTFPLDIKTIGKEYRNGWYGTTTYFLGKSMSDLPFVTVYPVLYCSFVWYTTGQDTDDWWRFWGFVSLMVVNALSSQNFGLILGAIFMNSVPAATFLGPVLTIPWYLFTGFTKRIHRLQEPYKTSSQGLFTRHIFEGMLDTVYGHDRCDCDKFLEQYQELRQEELGRLAEIASAETLNSLDYYDQLADVNTTQMIISRPAPVALGEANTFAATLSARASSFFTFGLDFEPSCPKNYKAYIIQEFDLNDDSLWKGLTISMGMFALTRLITFFIVAYKIRTKQ